jgi:hypothetical protein
MRLKFISSPREAEQLRRDNRHNDVESKEGDEDTQITPSIIERDTKRRVVIFSTGISAVLACRCRVGVVDVAADPFNVALCVLETLLATRRVEFTELLVQAFDFKSVHFSNDETRNETGEGIELIHPRPPELWHLWFSDRNTTEQAEEYKQERIDDSRDLDTWGECGHCLTSATRRESKHDQQPSSHNRR